MLHEGGESGVRQPHMFKSKGFGGFGPWRVSGKHNRAVVRLDSRKMVNCRRRKEQGPVSIGHSSIQPFPNGGLPDRAFVSPRESGTVKT